MNTSMAPENQSDLPEVLMYDGNQTTAPPPDGSWCWECYTGSWQHQTYLVLMIYVPPVLIALGTLGNVLNLTVLHRKMYRKSPAAVSLSALAVVDIGVLWTGLLRQWIMAVWSVDVRTVHRSICRVHMYVSYLTIVISTNILAMANVERTLSVCFPLKVKNWINRKRMTVVITIGAVVMAIIYLPIPIVSVVRVRQDGAARCGYLGTALQHYWVWVDLAVTAFLPFAIILASTVVIVVKLKQRKNLAGNAATPGGGKKNSTSIMLLAISAAFFVTMTPANLFYVGLEFDWFPRRTERDWAVFDLVYGATHVIMYVNNVINFALYCLAGSKFRKSLGDMFRATFTQPASVTTLDVPTSEPVPSTSALTSESARCGNGWPLPSTSTHTSHVPECDPRATTYI